MLCYHQIYPHSLQNINQGFISSPFSFASFYTNHLQITESNLLRIFTIHGHSPLHILVIPGQQSDLLFNVAPDLHPVQPLFPVIMRNGSLAYDPVLIEVGVHSLYEPFIKIISMPDRIYLTLDMLPDAYPRYEL